MGTEIFETFEDFLNREDKKVNGVSPEFADNQNIYIEHNETNIGCWNCIECTDCKGCYDCDHCKDCKDCVECEECDNCKSLEWCKGCYDCEYCNDCVDCVECEECENCQSLEKCNGYINNISPENKEKLMQIINICVVKNINFQYYQAVKCFEILDNDNAITHHSYLDMLETEDKLNEILKSL